jgi:hypothetical protein
LDIAKYFNHSCRPSCLGGEDEFEVAVRDLHAGEELTDDYATFRLDRPESFPCRCGADACRGMVQPEDAVMLAREWAQSLHAAMELAETVAQPLAPFFSYAGFGELRAASVMRGS